MSASHFRFAQVEVPGRLGLDDGRYLLRGSEDEPGETVLVVQTVGTPPARPSRRRRRPRPSEPGGEAPGVPLTRLTVIPGIEIDPRQAAQELARLRRDHEAAEERVAEALRAINRVLRAHRIATQDPYGHELSRDAVLGARVGHGTGSELAEGRWEEAVEVPAPERRRRRHEALRPAERVAAVIGGRERIDVCEVLLLRARADLDAGHSREAALQLRVGLDALLAEVPTGAGSDQADDLADLERRREGVAATAEQALHGELSGDRADHVAEALAIAERVLRRRQILRG